VPPGVEPSDSALLQEQQGPNKAAAHTEGVGTGEETPNGEILSIEHPQIDRFVAAFQTERRRSIQRGLDRSGRYVDLMTSILQEEGVPAELAYLPLIESGFRTGVQSCKRAAGLWQFIRATGKNYGLRIDRYVDERRDPEKSTRAAARYLRDLHDMFRTWPLALAAYNTGEQRVGGVLERRGEISFWEMMGRGYLYRETRDYVPSVLAAVRVGTAPTEFGFEAPVLDPLSYDVVEIDRSISLRQVAKLAGAGVDEVKMLNPALIRGVIPPDENGYEVRLPLGTGRAFDVAYARWQKASHMRVVGSVEPGPVADRVRRGDTPSAIARRLGVSVAALMYVNGWHDPRRLLPGDPVRLPLPKSQEATTRARRGSRVHVAAKPPSESRQVD